MKHAKMINCLVFGCLVFCGLLAVRAQAQNGPALLNFDGLLLSPGGTPITANSVNFKLEIWDKNDTCLIYSEQHLGVDLSNTAGAFSFKIGAGTSAVNNLESSTSFDAKIFLNSGSVAPFTGCPAGLNLPAGDTRALRVSYDIGSGYVSLTPDFQLTTTPFAMVADTLQGKVPTDLIQVHSDTNNQLTQANAENIFSTVNYPKIVALLAGTSSQFLSAAPSAPVSFNSQRITNITDPTGAQDAATKNYTDSTIGGKVLDISGTGLGVGGGKTLVWDQVLNKWVAQSVAGSVVSLTAGSGLLGGTVTTSGTLAVDVGTTASKIVQLNASAQLPAVDGSLLINVNAGKLQSRNVAANSPAAGQVLTWNATLSVWEPENVAGGGAITALTGDVSASGAGSVAATIAPNAVTSAKINNTGVAVNRLLMTDATTGTTVGYSTCSLNQVLQWTASGWACESVTAMLGSSGASAGTYGSNSTVPQVTVDGTGRVTAIASTNIAYPILSVAGRTGAVTLTAADIGGLGTASTLNVGLAANNLVQLNGSAQLPAVDGSLLTTVNASKIGGRTVSTLSPTAGALLGWNSSFSDWEPMPPPPSLLNGGNLFGNPVSIGTADSYPFTIMTGNAARMTFDTAGNVGIGTTSPAAKLDVAGGINVSGASNFASGVNVFSLTGSTALVIQAGLSGQNLTLNSSTTGAVNIGSTNGKSVSVLDPSNTSVNYLTLKGSVTGAGVTLGAAGTDTNVNLLLAPKGTGFVGIGTTTPNGTLEVDSVSASAIVAVVKGGAGQTGDLQNWLSNTGSILARVSPSGAVLASAGSASTPSLSFVTASNTGLFLAGSNTLGFANTGVETMRIAPSAVGIGTTSPAALLDVHGHVANSGTTATVGTCGTSPSILGNDARGTVTTGTATVTSCLITFNAAYATVPICVVSWNGAAVATTIASTATTANLTVNFSASSPSAVFNYHCMQ